MFRSVKMPSVKSYAKINLYLNVTKRYKNGYHAIKSVFSLIDLYDTIKYEFLQTENPVIVGCDGIPPEQNLIFKAIKLFQSTMRSIPFQVQLTIMKKIPMGGGLGGGSSNAAAVLSLLNRLYKTHYSKKTLMKMGASLGADVPFFINGGTQIVSGFGQIMHRLDTNMSFYLVLVLPNIHADTKGKYLKLDELNLCGESYNENRIFNTLTDGLKTHNFNKIGHGIYNKFEQVLFVQHPILSQIKSDILDCSAVNSFMTGSGSTMVGLFDSSEKALSAKDILERKGYACVCAKTLI